MRALTSGALYAAAKAPAFAWVTVKAAMGSIPELPLSVAQPHKLPQACADPQEISYFGKSWHRLAMLGRSDPNLKAPLPVRPLASTGINALIRLDFFVSREVDTLLPSSTSLAGLR